jgi:ferredoxin
VIWVKISVSVRTNKSLLHEGSGMVKISVDRDVCQNYGQCCFEETAVFSLDDSGTMRYQAEADESVRDDVERAADMCPTQAITVE